MKPVLACNERDSGHGWSSHFQVNQLMTELKTPLILVKLRKKTYFNPDCNNETRWISMYQMLLMHVELRQQVLRLNDTEIDALRPITASKRKLGNLIRNLKELDEVTKQLQRLDAKIWVAHVYFDTVLEIYPTHLYALDPDSRIFLISLFRSALVKI